MERAGSMFKKWVQTLLPCVWPECEERAPARRQQPWNNNSSVEREMVVCHQQPHLVPPMRLVVYDDLPSPGGIKQPSKASKLVQDGRSLAFRTGHRTMRSIGSLSSVRKSRQRPSISAPSNFQHLNQPPKSAQRAERFRPLVLSIHIPGNQLPELPEFGDFNVNHPSLLTPPPKTLASPFERYSDGQSFRVPRKSLPSNSNHHSSLSTGAAASNSRRATLPEPITRPTDRPRRVQTEPARRHTNEDWTNDQSTVDEQPYSPSTRQDFDSSRSLLSSPIPEDRPSDEDARDLTPPTPPFASESTPPRSRRPSQWSLYNSSATASPGQANPALHSRSRTLSGSTLSSAHAGRTSSFSSTGTATTAYAPPSLPVVVDKQWESPAFNTSCPTVYEGKQQQDVQPEDVYGQDRRHGAGGIGVAF